MHLRNKKIRTTIRSPLFAGTQIS